MRILAVLVLTLSLTGCLMDTRYNAPKNGRVGVLTVESFTNSNCLIKLKEKAAEMEVEVELEKVRPTLTGYRCSGPITE